ncbi:MAG: hypothetical protein WCA35_20625, partial [Kovacikia sp.]
GGSIQIHGQRVTLSGASQVNSETTGNQNGGNIFIRAAQLEVSENSSISTVTSGAGNSGDIAIETNRMRLEGSGISTGTILGRGRAGNLTIHATDYINLINNGNLGSLSVGTGDGNITGSGGNISLTTGTLTVINSGIFAATFLGQGNAGSLTIHATNSVDINGGTLSTSSFGAGTGGEMFIQTKDLRVAGGGGLITSTFDPRTFDFNTLDPRLYTQTFRDFITNLVRTISPDNVGKASSGNLTVIATDSVKLSGTSANGQTSSSLTTQTLGAGNAGNVAITTRQLIVRDSAFITSGAGSGSQGRGGNLTINATDFVELGGVPANEQNFSRLVTQTEGTGSAGDLTINTGRLIIQDGAFASSGARLGSQGNGGRLTVNASDSVQLMGGSDNGRSFSGLTTQTEGIGSAGDLTINTKRLLVRDGAFVSSGVIRSQGKGGNLTVNASDSIELGGVFGSQFLGGLTTQTTGIGDAGDLRIYTGQLILRDRGEISAATFNRGNGGKIYIQADALSMESGATISSISRQQGKAGSIEIVIRDRLQANNSSISSNSTQVGGGSIEITARNIFLQGNSDITTNVFSGVGNGGNITLSANTIVALKDSDILAFARDGQGGNITLNTRAFFGQNYRPAAPGTDPTTLDGNNRVDINASGRISGIVSLPDVSFLQNSLTEFPQTLVDPNRLLANSCIVRSRQQSGTFFITGSGGLPARPGDAAVSAFPTGEVRSVEGPGPGEGWKLGDPITEPQGVYRLPSGQLVISRECPE